MTFIAGETSKNYVVIITDDVEVEESEYVAFGFDTSALPVDVVVGSPDQHLLTLTDNDGYRVEFATTSQTVAEGDFSVDVTVSIFPMLAAVDAPITIPIVVDASSTATMADCTLPDPSSVTFIAGETSKNYVVIITDDVEVEESEYVAFAFDTSALPADVVVGSPDQHLLTLTDNDGYRVEFATASQTVAEDAVSVSVLVSIFPALDSTDAPITIPIVVDASSTATMADCTLPDPSSVTFIAGETSKNYVVTIVDDVEVEESESVAFAFDTSALPVDVVVGSPDQHLLTLTDNDGYRVEFATASQTVAEDDS